MLDRSAVGQLPSSSSRTKWQWLPAGGTLRIWQQFPYYQCYLRYCWPADINLYRLEPSTTHYVLMYFSFSSQTALIQPNNINCKHDVTWPAVCVDRHEKLIRETWPGPLAESWKVHNSVLKNVDRSAVGHATDVVDYSLRQTEFICWIGLLWCWQAWLTHLRLQVLPDRVVSRLWLLGFPRRSQEAVRHRWRTEPRHCLPLHWHSGIKKICCQCLTVFLFTDTQV